MSSDSVSIQLAGHFLIAMPSLSSEEFARTVVYMCEHNRHGAMGLVINKPTKIRMPELFEKVDLPFRRQDLIERLVFHGGPVHTERGFVLHKAVQVSSPDQNETAYQASLRVPGGLEMTTSRDVLEAISSGVGPQEVFVSLGYAGWQEGQLESELQRNSWLTVEADPHLIFEAPVHQRYEKALSLLGVQEHMLSNEVGHA